MLCTSGMSEIHTSKSACKWIDTNLELFGSDVEKKVKLESAQTESAWQPVLKNVEPRLYVWRIQKFQVKSWSKELHGQFFNGDSYIVLNVHQNREDGNLLYDVHFWIGRESTQDEYATAAYKTVELDTALNGKAVQHREVEGYESELFVSYFPQMIVLSGGCEGGFKRVKPEAYKTRLLRFTVKDGHARSQEVPASRKSLDSTGVFILDRGLQITQWNGERSNKTVCYRAQQFALQLRSERNGAPVVDPTLKEQDAHENHPFYKALTDAGEDDSEGNGFGSASRNSDTIDDFSSRILFRLSDASGNLQFEEIARGDELDRGLLSEQDVFILDTRKLVFVYVGSAASINERRNALSYAHTYLRDTDHPFASITVVSAGLISKQFEQAFQKPKPAESEAK